MSAAIDHIIDTISHFIGEMRVLLEDMRARSTPEDGPGIPQKLAPLSLHPEEPSPAAVKDIPIGKIEGVDYVLAHGADPLAFEAGQDAHAPIEHQQVYLPPGEDNALPDLALSNMASHHHVIPSPADYIAVIQQYAILIDQDIVVVGYPDFALPLPVQPVLELEALELAAREAAGGLSSLEPVYSHTGLSQFSKDTYTVVAGAEAPTAAAPALSGQWINGAPLDGEAPKLEDHIPASMSLEAVKASQSPYDGPANAPVQKSIEIDASKTDTTMEVSSGFNLIVNDAQLISAGVTATTIAVSGDYYCLDVIVQINAISACADIDGSLPASMSFSQAEDVLTNLAEFESITRDDAGAMAEKHPGAMPKDWAITTVDSDLISFNWLYQYNFMADGDSLVLTATGTTSTIATGGNITINATGISYMGMTYDLMLVGGNLYDINYISQLNVLYDHDTIGPHGNMAHNAGTIEAGGNVLWNQAQITRIGASEWQQGVPDHYTGIMDQLDKGNMAMPKSLASDGAFEGYSNLKVLYVKGNIYDINYIEQVNVAGDPDKVLLYAEETFGKAVDWTVHTGGNVLVNAAAIIDYQGMGDTAHLGGMLYSHAMLLQAEIIKTGNEAPTQIVTEALAFIAEDFDTEDNFDNGTLGLSALATPAPEGLDAMLA